MSRGITTSIRLDPELRKRLEKASHLLHRGKNWIISHALEEFLRKINHKNLAEEVRRQSLLANKEANLQEEEFWQEMTDHDDWKA